MADKYDYDVLYIGAGHGTFDGAIPLAQKGFKIAVVEADKVGGTCPNWGCNAKIALDIPVQLTETQKRLQNIINGDTSINWKENMANKHKVIDGLPDAISGLIESLNIKLIHGFAKLSDNHTVTVGDNSYSADKIVLATGLRPHRLDVEGKELAHDSKDFLNLDEMPKHVAIIGAGYIAMEFATIANAAGAQVTILMHGDKALRQFNQEYVDMVMKDLEDKGVRFIKNADIKGFVQKDDCVTAVQLADEDVRTDYILDATGRIPNVENIGLDDLGIKYDKKGIKVNDHLATDVDNIYASGDVADTGQPKLTPTAMFESKYLTSLFSGETKDAIDFPAIPSVVFTTPRIAEVGVSVDEAKDSDDEYTVEETDMTKDWYRAITKEQIAKRAYVFDKEHHLVGATEVSDQADSVIDSILPAVALKLDQKQIGRLVHLFPSIGSDAWQSI